MKRASEKPQDEVCLYVSPDGNDAWTGQCPTTRGRKGPLATIRAAQRKARALVAQGKGHRSVRVCLRGGTYALTAPLVFTPADSGVPADFQGENGSEPKHGIVYAAYRNEKPVLSGGRRITNWRTQKLNAKTVWVASLPRVKAGKWYFRELWVNGERRFRPRLPRTGEYRIERVLDASFKGTHNQTIFHGSERFGYAAGDLKPWCNLRDVEICAITLWVERRMRIKSLDQETRTVFLDRNSQYRLTDDHGKEGALYFVENVLEALEEPGQWYLDRAQGKLYYLPKPGENPRTAVVMAPVLPELVRIEGKKDRPVRRVRFEGLRFAYAEKAMPESYSGSAQAANEVPGAIRLQHALYCSFDRCRVEHVGSYGIELIEDCRHIQVRRCRIRDLGAGGVKVWHGCRCNTISDCEIADGGHLYMSAVGVLIGRATGNQVLHNSIHDFFYTGVSVGWLWGYAESDTYGNIVEWNHIHDIGKGKLSDMGGIYTLGVQPGTRLRFNLIHDVTSRTYGGWAIYPDEGSSRILIENNICYRTKCAPFHQHYGRDNVVRNNIFAFGKEDQVARSKEEDHLSFLFEKNIVYFTEGRLLNAGYRGQIAPGNATFRGNLYWDASGRKLDFCGRTFKQWQAMGMDAGSLVADPRFAGPGRSDFRLKKNSPAAKIGFIPFDLAGVGPRG